MNESRRRGAHELLRNVVASPKLRGRPRTKARKPLDGAGIEAPSRTIEAMMTCRQLVDFLAEYVADGLEVSERTAFAAHLADCPACADYVRSYRDTIALAKDAARDDEAAVAAMPPELVDAILDAARRRRS